MDKELLEISGSKENYKIDMNNFIESLEKNIKKLRSTKAGRARLKRAGLK